VLFYDLGLHYARDGLLPEALAAFEGSAAIDARGSSMRGAPSAGARAALIRAELRRNP
jgi:hypothetical protein